MERRENPSSFRLTRSQIELINQKAIESGIPKNRIVRLAIDQFFADRTAA
jgi:predicted DNA binding CopG/RHH family protein